MITPVTASETYLPTRRAKSITRMGHRRVVGVKHWRRRAGFSPFFKQHRPAGEELWIPCEKQDGEECEKQGDGALSKAETQPVRAEQSYRLHGGGACLWQQHAACEASLHAPQFPVLLHDHSLGFGLRLGSLVLPETQPAFGRKGGDHVGPAELCAGSAGAEAELPGTQAAVEEGDPQPARQQEDEHEWERKRKPGAEVDQFAVWKVAGRQRKCLTPRDLGGWIVLGGVF